MQAEFQWVQFPSVPPISMLGWHSGDCASFVMRNYQGFESLTQLQFASISRLACSIGPKHLPNAQPYPPTWCFRNIYCNGLAGGGSCLCGYGGWHRRYTRSTASFALKDVPIGVRCGIVLGEKTPDPFFDGFFGLKRTIFFFVIGR